MTSTRTAARIASTASVRSLVAPTPTGSRTTGTPRSFASLPAASIASTQAGSRVPMLSTRAPAWPTISRTSPIAWAMTGEAPMWRVTFAVSFMTT